MATIWNVFWRESSLIIRRAVLPDGNLWIRTFSECYHSAYPKIYLRQDWIWMPWGWICLKLPNKEVLGLCKRWSNGNAKDEIRYSAPPGIRWLNTHWWVCLSGAVKPDFSSVLADGNRWNFSVDRCYVKDCCVIVMPNEGWLMALPLQKKGGTDCQTEHM